MADNQREQHEKLLAGMKDGESFFIPDVTPEKLGYVRQLGYKLKIRLSIRFILKDPIYGKMGTRVRREGVHKSEKE